MRIPPFQTRTVLIGLLLLGLMVFSALTAPWVSPYHPDRQAAPATTRFLPPSLHHWFGTDQFGRDVFSRVLYGGRISLLIALLVTGGALVLGTLYGSLSGYLGGIWDQVMMRLLDLLLAFPVVFLAVACMALFGGGLFWLITVLIATGWMDIARVVRAEVHSLKERPFILKARAAGLSTSRTVLCHLIPNLLATILAFAVIRVADIILIESALSFLGLGVQAPQASWGSIINDGQAALASAWWISLFPGLAIIITIMGLHMTGDGLRMARQQ